MMEKLYINRIEAEYGIRIVPVTIIGRRWSFAGDNTDISPGQSLKIQLDDKSGVVIYNWDNVPEEKRSLVEQAIKENLFANRNINET